MKLLFRLLRLQYLRSLTWLRIEGGDVFGDRDLDAMLRFDLKTEHGRARPADDVWQKLHSRIAEHEQQQAAQVYQPASQKVAVTAWSPWNGFLPRLSQAVVALFLFFVMQSSAPSLLDAPSVADNAPAVQPSVFIVPPRGDFAPQVNRAFEMERSYFPLPEGRAEIAPANEALRTDQDLVREERIAAAAGTSAATPRASGPQLAPEDGDYTPQNDEPRTLNRTYLISE